MPTKKTTTKKSTNKKPVTKKTTTKKVTTRKPTTSASRKTPSVIIKENPIKKINHTSSFCPSKMGPIVGIFLLLINTILLLIVAFKLSSHKALFQAMDDFEAMRVGGKENHQIMKEIYQMDAYKKDQKMRLDTTLNALKQMDAQGTTPTAVINQNTNSTTNNK